MEKMLNKYSTFLTKRKIKNENGKVKTSVKEYIIIEERQTITRKIYKLNDKKLFKFTKVIKND